MLHLVGTLCCLLFWATNAHLSEWAAICDTQNRIKIAMSKWRERALGIQTFFSRPMCSPLFLIDLYTQAGKLALRIDQYLYKKIQRSALLVGILRACICVFHNPLIKKKKLEEF